jgi:tetratricopeptide (TPR) repeat protein
MQKLLPLFLLLFGLNTVAQNFQQAFKAALGKNDTTKALSIITEWEKTAPSDPELYTAAFNLYFLTSEQTDMALEREQKSKESIAITDSTGKTVGYLNAKKGYNPAKIAKAFYYINQGIAQFPDRLDMRWGKCYVLGQTGDYENFTNEVIAALQHAVTIQCKWLWTNNQPTPNPQKEMLEAVHTYMKQLYDTEDDKLVVNMQRIGDVALFYYPNHIEILTSTSVAYMLTGNYTKALGYLKWAEKLNPKDFIVLNNMARCYELNRNKANALKYYQLAAKHGDAEAKETAKRKQKELRR